jgi:hypothetical protein
LTRDYEGRTHNFRVPIGPRPDGKIGPPTEVVIYGSDARDRIIGRGGPARWRVVYERFDAEHNRLI